MPAAWTGRNGGQSRVLEKPGRGAFAMMPIAQSLTHPMLHIPLNHLQSCDPQTFRSPLRGDEEGRDESPGTAP